MFWQNPFHVVERIVERTIVSSNWLTKGQFRRRPNSYVVIVVDVVVEINKHSLIGFSASYTYVCCTVRPACGVSIRRSTGSAFQDDTCLGLYKVNMTVITMKTNIE